MILAAVPAPAGSDGTGLAATGLGILLILAGTFAWYVRNRESPSAGWKVAIKNLETRCDDLEQKVATLTTEGAAKDAVIAQQQKALDAKDGRIVQLLTAWPDGSRPPSPSPAHQPYL